MRSARPGPETGDIGKLISWGPSPRASQALMLVARARALIDGRLSPSIDDVMEMAEPILKHRMALTFAARADGESIEARHRQAQARASDNRMAAARRADKHEVRATQHASGEARALAETMPRLILEARRIAATVIHGLHGRRRAGPGENFWQYRRFLSGEPARRVDWRRSARDDNLYVREQEWEAAHTVWMWPDRSPSMLFTSRLAQESKLDRCLVVAFALAEVLVQAGERVGMPGLMRPTGSRNVLDKMANAIVHDVTERPSLPRILCALVARRDRRGIGFLEPDGGGARDACAARPRPARMAIPCRSSIRRKRPFPIPAASNSSSRKVPARSPPAAPKPGKASTRRALARHRAEIRAETDKLGWSFTIHRTDRPATELLLALHARLGAPPPGAVDERACAHDADVPGGRDDAMASARLRAAAGAARAVEPAGAVVAAAAHSAAAAPHRFSARRGCCSTSRPRRRRRSARRGGSRCCG